MKLLATLFLSLLSLPKLSQENKDYIINLKKDTTYLKVVSIDRFMKIVICEVNGKKIKYNAKDILAVQFDTLIYETGFVKLKDVGSKQYVFLCRKVGGNLNLYETKVGRAGFTLSALLIWAKNGTAWGKRRWETIVFYKLKNETREEFSKYWKEKTKDCLLLYNKHNSKITPWSPTPKELVQFYNINCN